MVEKTVALYVFIDDLLKFTGHKEPESRRVNDVEVVTAALIVGMKFGAISSMS
jgi:hypothetical protein